VTADREAPTLHLMCGLPGSGKTTTARRIAAATGAVRLAPDEWLIALRLDHMSDGPRARVEELQWALAQELLAADTSVILEAGFWSRRERDAMRGRARELGVRVRLWFLDVAFAERWRRIDARNHDLPPDCFAVTHDELASYDEMFEAPSTDELAIFDD
jgi:predicted kinase